MLFRPIPTKLQLRRSRLLVLLGAALISALLVLRIRFTPTVVLGKSMLPTLHPGDLLLVDKCAYRKADPRRGDIISAQYDNEAIVKRIIGLPGEELEMKDGVLYINSSPAPQGSTVHRGNLDISKGKISEGKFATLGDNQAVSSFAVVSPTVSRDEIIGKVVWVGRFWRPQSPGAN